MKLIKDIERGVFVINTLVNAFRANELFGCNRFPEDIMPEDLEIGSNEHLLYLSFISSIAYLRKEERLWNLAKDAYEDNKDGIIFNPEKILNSSINSVDKELKKYGLLVNPLIVKQWNLSNPKSANRKILEGRDLEMWINMALALKDFGSDVKKLCESFDFDGVKILEEFSLGKYSNCFPEYHKARKVILWMVRLQRYAKFKLKNLNKLPMPIGMHIIRATFMSGAISGEVSSIMLDLYEILSDYWYEVSHLEKNEFSLSPIEFQIYLWILSKHGCSKGRRDHLICRLQDECPLGEYCSEGVFKTLGTYIKVDTQQK
ncbi:hypothetical protein KAU33_11210 [Candidatus Dependentiae bacterium]|nr:hypothetical protein [Candidatus Dependentiae bacterium]